MKSGLFALALIMLLLSGCATAERRDNLGDLKLDLYRYESSGQYAADVAALDNQALSYIMANAHKVSKPAIVLDIDETSLSNWPQLKANDLTFKIDGPCEHLPKGPCGLSAWQKAAKAEAIQPTLALFNTVKRQGVAVFFITGRDESVRAATAKNLKAAGFDGWQELILRPKGTTTPSAEDYKAPQRARIEKTGYTIIATIGDQPSDLSGGHAMKGFLVPNPFYRIP